MPFLRRRLSVQVILSALLLALLGFAAQPIQPAYAWAMDCSNAANLAAMQVDQAQCESLESIYDNLGGTGWTNNTGWGTPTDVGIWEGVTRVGGNVTEIQLDHNNLIGNIDSVDMTGLTGLQYIDLQANQIAGNIDGFDLTGLSNLQFLRLIHNQIGGDIAAWNLSSMGLTGLQEMELYDNPIGGNIDGFDLTGLSNLEQLYMTNTQVGGNIDNWDPGTMGLTSLQSLILSANQIGGDIGNWAPSGVGLPSLQLLNIGGNQIGGNIDGMDITSLSGLIQITLSYNQIGGNIDGLTLTGMSNLQMVDIMGNQVGGDIAAWNVNGMGLTNLQYLYFRNNQIGGNIDGFDLTGMSNMIELAFDNNQIGGDIGSWNLAGMGLTSMRWMRLPDNQIGGDIGNLNLSGLNTLFVLELQDNQIGGDPSGITGIPASMIILFLDGNQMNGTVPDLTGTSMLYLGLCANPTINPTGTPAIDNFAETYAYTWTAASGCGVTGLVTSAACNGDNLDVTITTGDGPFNITGTAGPSLPQNGVHIGLITLPGPDSWTAVTVTETTDDLQSANLGDFDCPSPNLAATAACNGDDLNITIAAGDANFDISADDPAAAIQAQNGVALGGPYTLVSSGGGGQWTNITITELGGDTEMLNLSDTTCPPPAVASSSGGSAPSAQASASCITIDVEADREVVAIGDPVKWTLAVRNSCTNTVDNVIVSGQLPGSLTPLDLTTSRGEISRPLPDFEVQLGTMQPQESVEMWIDSRVAAGVGLVLPEGAAGQSAGQTICLTGLVTGDSDTDCVSLFPDMLPSTGGEPVNQSQNWGWLAAAGILIIGLGGYAIRRRTA